MPATLLNFCQANDAAAATSKKLAKQKILAEYFTSIEHDDDLRLAVRYAAGRVFAATDERVLGASGAIVTDAAMSLWKIDYPTLRAAAIKHGELGEALGSIIPSPFGGGLGRGRRLTRVLCMRLPMNRTHANPLSNRSHNSTPGPLPRPPPAGEGRVV